MKELAASNSFMDLYGQQIWMIQNSVGASASSSSAETWWHFVTCIYLPKKAFVDLHSKKGPTVATAVFLVVLETA